MAAMVASTRSTRWRAGTPRSRKRWRRYAREVRRPLPALVLLLPLILIYEVTAWIAARQATVPHDLWAPTAIQDLLAWFGLVGFWVPPVLFVAVLLLWHRRRRDQWRLRLDVVFGMVGESLLLAVPLWVLSALFATPAPVHTISALGAAVYEEFVFRLLLLSGLTWLLIEIGQVRQPTAVVLAAVATAFLFALCHFQPLGAAPFGWKSFLFKTVAGLYFAIVFVGRGFGLAGGCHAAYNVLLVTLSRAEAG